LGRSGQVLVSVSAPKVGTTLTISVSPTSGPAPLSIVVSGKLTENVYGYGLGFKTINLIINGEVISSTDTKSTGTYALYATLTSPGTYVVETEFPGDAEYEGCEVHNGVTVAGEEVPPPDYTPVIIGAIVAVVVSVSAGTWLLSR